MTPKNPAPEPVEVEPEPQPPALTLGTPEVEELRGGGLRYCGPTAGPPADLAEPPRHPRRGMCR